MPGPGSKSQLYNLLEQGCLPKLGCHIPIKFAGQLEGSVHTILVMCIGGLISMFISVCQCQSSILQFGPKLDSGVGIWWSFYNGMVS